MRRPILRFKYNPTEYSLSKSAEWNRPPTSSATRPPSPSSRARLPATVQMEIFFDACEELFGDVSGDVETLLEWTKPTELSSLVEQPQPPLLAFHWGVSSAHGRLRRLPRSR